MERRRFLLGLAAMFGAAAAVAATAPEAQALPALPANPAKDSALEPQQASISDGGGTPEAPEAYHYRYRRRYYRRRRYVRVYRVRRRYWRRRVYRRYW